MDSRFKEFYQNHERALLKNYPGLTPERFAREIRDIIKLNLSFEEIEKLLLSGTPFQYILGECDFYQDTFIVSKDVLIPRSETEILVEKVLEKVTPQMKVFADIGCGSGCIGLSILKAKDSLNGVMVDISDEALKVAEANAKKLQVNARAHFIKSDRMQNVAQIEFDFIVSNPPYIKEHADKKLVHDKVIEFEPHLALFLPDENYLNWFSVFFQDVYKKLKAGGFFFMEGHENHLQELFEICPFNQKEIIQDYTKRDRFLFCQK